MEVQLFAHMLANRVPRDQNLYLLKNKLSQNHTTTKSLVDFAQIQCLFFNHPVLPTEEGRRTNVFGKSIGYERKNH